MEVKEITPPPVERFFSIEVNSKELVLIRSAISSFVCKNEDDTLSADSMFSKLRKIIT